MCNLAFDETWEMRVDPIGSIVLGEVGPYYILLVDTQPIIWNYILGSIEPNDS